MPVISSPTRSRYSSNIMSRSASRIRCRITCLAVCAAMRPKSSGVTSRVSIWSSYSLSFSRSISGSARLAHLAGLGVDVRDLALGSASAPLPDQLLLELRRDHQLADAEVAELAVHLDPRVRRRAGRLLVGGQQRVLERDHQLLARDALLAREAPDGIKDLLRHAASLSWDEVGPGDVRVRDRDDAVVGGDRDLLLGRADELAGERRVAVACVPRAHAGATAEEAVEVRPAW